MSYQIHSTVYIDSEKECLTSGYCSLSETYELKRQQHLADLQRKEDEMRQTFVIRVKEKEAQLKETEKEVLNKRN